MTLLRVEKLSKTFIRSTNPFNKNVVVQANHNINLSLEKGKTLAIMGESGSGKTTLARQIIGIEKPSSGSIWLNDQLVKFASRKDKKKRFRSIRMVFQDPYDSLNPKIRIGHSLEQTLIINTNLNSRQRLQKIKETLIQVGLSAEHRHHYPHMFSVGQRQRIAIARAIILQPEIIIADEPLSALDVSVKSQILNLLQSLQENMGVSYLFISHDLRVVEHLADDVIVMCNGKIVEKGSITQVFDQPRHPYTQSLFASTPLYRNRFPHFLRQLQYSKEPMSKDACVFSARCSYCDNHCKTHSPLIITGNKNHEVACFNLGLTVDII